MDKTKNSNLEPIKTLKIVRDAKTYHAYYNHQELKDDPDYDYGINAFLHTLYLVLDDFGQYMPIILKKKLTSFGGNSTWGEIQQNKFLFGDDFEDATFEMDFDEFLKINIKYQEFCHLMADEIIFRRIGNKVSIEGIWNKSN